jgi:hypothetical protein
MVFKIIEKHRKIAKKICGFAGILRLSGINKENKK